MLYKSLYSSSPALLRRLLAIALCVGWLAAPPTADAGRSRATVTKKAKLEKKKRRSRRPRGRLYRSRRGDNLRRVAKRFGVTVLALRRANPSLRRLRSTRRLRTGRRLRVPARRPSRYRFVQMTTGPGYRVQRPERAWGTLLTVTRLQDAASAYARRFPEAEPLVVHDLSARRGGRMRPHKSHRAGRDVDIRVPVNYRTDRYVKATAKTIDLARTWYFLRTLLDTDDVQYIFLDRRLQRPLYRHAKAQGATQEELDRWFQYPARVSSKCEASGAKAAKKKCGVRRQPNAVIRHERGHADHFHVRFHRAKRRPLPIS